MADKRNLYLIHESEVSRLLDILRSGGVTISLQGKDKGFKIYSFKAKHEGIPQDAALIEIPGVGYQLITYKDETYFDNIMERVDCSLNERESRPTTRRVLGKPQEEWEDIIAKRTYTPIPQRSPPLSELLHTRITAQDN